ncbi:hypothetical protein EW146_g7492 [Bondarzewia mesenterica]|uniref:J domain-containing protein n=1 Tax=Bondarzewia mesenterica TaxID=1095465 RepID=A0A4V3XE81_9AGAM|nr:hypothetical protein EW146_g7492 [Bondarzewia mesenterica]
MADVISLTVVPPPLPKSWTPPAASGKSISPLVERRLIPAGPAYLAHVRRGVHNLSFEEHDKHLEEERKRLEALNGNGENAEDDLGVGDEEETEDLLTLDPKEWKKQDHYAVLGLSHLRYRATDEQIKIAHRKKVLKHHPDKKAGFAGDSNDDAFFKCIQKAMEVLTNKERRRQFDSVDPFYGLIEDDVPTASEIKNAKNLNAAFFKLFSPVFEREARFSRKEPVPLLGKYEDSKEQVEGFYDFWYNFDSWRSFEYLDKEVNEGSDNRDDKRFTEKKNKSERARRKKEDTARRRKRRERPKRKIKTSGNTPAAQVEEEKRRKEEEAKKKEDEENAARAEAKKAKTAAANAAKKARRAARAAEETETILSISNAPVPQVILQHPTDGGIMSLEDAVASESAPRDTPPEPHTERSDTPMNAQESDHTESNYPNSRGVTVGTLASEVPNEDGLEEGEADGDEDEILSEVSDGGDLRADLEAALTGDFDFKGKYAHGQVLPDAPNPGLYIEGLGLIGLPLSNVTRNKFETLLSRLLSDIRNGQSSIQMCGTLGKSNHKRLALLATPRVGNVLSIVSSGSLNSWLDCDVFSTEKSEGMFATIIIVLPSLYAGGQVHVSHGTSKQVFDFASDSAFSTTLLTWYADVMHEVKSITSGYRLALSYNLIHTSPGIPRPSLPNMHTALTQLHHVLRKWHQDKYRTTPDSKLIAFLLEHEYSEVNLRSSALKGMDAHRIAHVRDVAEKLGFVVCLANLEYWVSGCADDYGEDYYKRGRWGYEHGGGSDTPAMLEESDSSLTLENLVDLNGDPVLSSSKISLSDEDLIPERPFQGQGPDDADYEGYAGNEAGSVEYYEGYRRTVLILFHEDDETEILLNEGGMSYALKKIQQVGNSENPSAEASRIAAWIMEKMPPSKDVTAAKVMANLAVQWNDLDKWHQVVTFSGAEKNMNVLGRQNFMDAWKKFSFERVKEFIKDRIEFIESLSPLAVEDQDAIVAWCDIEYGQALAALKNPSKVDVPVLLRALHTKGLAFLLDNVFPQFVAVPPDYDFWAELVVTLHNQKASFCISADATSTFEKAVEKSLMSAIQQFPAVVAEPPKPFSSYPYYSGQQQNAHDSLADEAKITRVTYLVNLCIVTGQMHACANLLALLLRQKGELHKRFQNLYEPLIPKLRDVLLKHKISMSSKPFQEFSKLLVGSYLQEILRDKSTTTQHPDLRKVGCGCDDCRTLDNFLLSASSKHDFRAIQKRRSHLELTLASARDLVQWTTITHGSPYTLQVTKHQHVIDAGLWKARQAAAKSFLVKLGTSAEISAIMGPRYNDVVMAVDGRKRYVLTAPAASAVGSGSGIQPEPPLSSSSDAIPSGPPSANLTD